MPLRKLKEAAKRTKLGKNFFENYDFKTVLTATISLVISVGFAVMNGVSGIMYRSVWYGSLAAYYIALILFRGGVVLTDYKMRKKYAADERGYERAKLRIHLASGAILVIVALAMCAAVTTMVLSDHPSPSGEIMAISTAAYTFYKLTIAIINAVKAKKSDNPVTKSLRYLNLSDACMSMVSLTVVLVTTFSEGEEELTSMISMKALAGFLACAVVLGLAVLMIVRSAKMLGVKENGREE